MTDTNPQFTAMLLLEQHRVVTYVALAEQVARIAPASRLGDWSGPIDDPSKAAGIECLSLDGQQMAVLAVDAPAPAIALDFGPIPNLLWPDPSKDIARQRAHVMIISPGNANSRAEAVAKARAVTLVAAAYAALVPTLGVVWVDAGNLVSYDVFKSSTGRLAAPNGLAVAFWVRVCFAPAQPAGSRKIIVGTRGLSGLGHLELEYAPTTDAPAQIASHALSTCAYLLSSGAKLEDGQTIGVEGQTRFVLTLKPNGTFAPGPVITLEAR